MSDKSPPETHLSPSLLSSITNAVLTPIRRISNKLMPLPDPSVLLHVSTTSIMRRLGGSCLAQVYGETGNEAPDVDEISFLVAVSMDTEDSLVVTIPGLGGIIDDVSPIIGSVPG